MNIISIIVAIIGLALGAGAGYLVRQKQAAKKVDSAEGQAATLLKEAKEKEKSLLLKAKEQSIKIEEETKQEEKKRRDQIVGIEQRLEKRETGLEQKLDGLEKERDQIKQKQQELEEIKEKMEAAQGVELKKIDELRQKQLERLEKIASLSKERAEQLVLELTEQNMKDRVLKEMKKYEDHLEAEKEKLAKRIITMTISRMASEVTAEHSTSTIELPSEEMKGRIIGREGRNIKALEQLTGVELLVDEMPGAIVISSFNAIRRYVAKLAIETLIHDGRIHPGHIEEAVKKAKKNVEQKIREAGQAALNEVGLGNQHPKLAEVAGRLLFRTSYGQNQLKHAVEVAHLAALMAEEVGANVKIAKTAGFLHDIGKAVDHEVEGNHTEIGVKLMKKFGFGPAIIQAASTHHGDSEFATPEDFIVAAADAISAARPGARRNTNEEFVKRVKELENIAKSFEGVQTAFAIEAGREVRIMVEPDKIDDLKAKKLANAISDKIEKDLTYPGEIKVSVIRETRAIEFAR